MFRLRHYAIFLVLALGLVGCARTTYRLGPVGGPGGQDFDEPVDGPKLAASDRLSGIDMFYNAHILGMERLPGYDLVNYIRSEYTGSDGKTFLGQIHGGGPVGCCEFVVPPVIVFAKGDDVIGICGRAGQYIDSIGFIRRSDVFNPCISTGGKGGNDYWLYAPPGYHVRQFYGRSGAALDAIGIIAEKDSSNAPLQYNNYRLGAVGGWGGDHFEDNELSRAARLIRIAVRASCYVDYVQFSYAETGQPSVLGEKHGGNGISCNRSGGIISQEQAIDLASDEYLIGLQGRASEYVNHIEFVTNKRIFNPFPDTGEGHPFSLLLPRDSSLKIRRLFGRSGDTLDAVGVIVE